MSNPHHITIEDDGDGRQHHLPQIQALTRVPADLAAGRAAAAARRARLEAGKPLTIQEVIEALEAAHLERSRSAEALRRSDQAHLDAAHVHAEAADRLDRAGRHTRAEDQDRKSRR